MSNSLKVFVTVIATAVAVVISVLAFALVSKP